MAFSPVASGIFAFRNVGKTERGEFGRAPVAAGQFKTIFDEIKAYDKTIAKGTESAINLIRETSGNKEALKGFDKVLGFCSENVNPLICLSSIIQVARADDQRKEAIIQAPTLGFMFFGERCCKTNWSKIAKFFKNIAQKLSLTKLGGKIMKAIETHNMGGKVGEIVKGATFLTCSIGSSAIGNKIGHAIADKMDEHKEVSLFKENSADGSLKMAA